MGTDKRNRQKENRRARQTEVAQHTQRQKLRRRITRFAVLIAVVFAIVALIRFTSNNDQTNTATSDSSIPADSVAATESTVSQVTGGPFVYGEGECAPGDDSGAQVQKFATAPKLCIDLTKTYTAVVSTSKGDLTVVLDAKKSPGAVNNFVNLVRSKYFDGTICHRAIPTFMVQCGDPTATGSGGPGYEFADELPAAGEYKIGSLAMANSGPNTSGSQFFIITGEQGVTLPPNYTLFGQVTKGLDTTLPALDKAGNDDPASNGVPPKEELRITKVTISES